jgi:hypothetical protein
MNLSLYFEALGSKPEATFYWMTSRQHLRVSQFRFRAEKARFPCENLDFLGLNRKLRGSQIRREVLHCLPTVHNQPLWVWVTFQPLNTDSFPQVHLKYIYFNDILMFGSWLFGNWVEIYLVFPFDKMDTVPITGSLVSLCPTKTGVWWSFIIANDLDFDLLVV